MTLCQGVSGFICQPNPALHESTTMCCCTQASLPSPVLVQVAGSEGLPLDLEVATYSAAEQFDILGASIW